MTATGCAVISRSSAPAHAGHYRPVSNLGLTAYQSTRFCLEQRYPAVAVGGAVLIDDYHTFTGCRKAVDEFRAERGIRDPLITAEPDAEAYWFKTR